MRLLLGTAMLLVLGAQDPPLAPYADPAQLEVPFPKHSHLKQPWRGWVETRPAADFLQGIGINYNVPGNDELAVRLLAEAGIRAARKEIGWGGVLWDESGVQDGERLRKLFGLFKRHGIRPTILLNCHQGVPCPAKFFDGRLLVDAPEGATTVRIADPAPVVLGRTGLSGLSDYWAAEALITALDRDTGTCTLSKPLPHALKAGKLPLATLKYLPLHPAGTPEFDETVEGWIRYARIAGGILAAAGIDDFDLEIFNELTFGTKFLDIRNYVPARAKAEKDFLHEGGSCWELARRTTQALKKEFPKIRIIWGFSNTTFFHTAIEQLPPGTDGQSYHPYGTGTRRLPDQEYHKGQPGENVDGFTPTTEVRLPEGIAATFIQTESIMRLIEPRARTRKPPGVERFRHYLTEHGVLAPECGVRDEAGAWALKTKCALRSYCLWLHQGIDVVHFYAAWYKDPLEFGLLPPALPTLPADAAFDDVAPPPLRALRSLTRAFAGSSEHPTLRPLGVELAPLGEPRTIFKGPTSLTDRDVFAFLPWQATDRSYVIAIYVMTWDALAPFPEARYRLRIRGISAAKASLLDPVTGAAVPLRILDRGEDWTQLEAGVGDTPRLLTLER